MNTKSGKRDRSDYSSYDEESDNGYDDYAYDNDRTSFEREYDDDDDGGGYSTWSSKRIFTLENARERFENVKWVGHGEKTGLLADFIAFRITKRIVYAIDKLSLEKRFKIPESYFMKGFDPVRYEADMAYLFRDLATDENWDDGVSVDDFDLDKPQAIKLAVQRIKNRGFDVEYVEKDQYDANNSREPFIMVHNNWTGDREKEKEKAGRTESHPKKSKRQRRK